MIKKKKNKLNITSAKKRISSAGFITENSKQTRQLGQLLAQELKSGTIICLSGDLGSGKTTFAQGVLKGLKAQGPYTSPTFLIMKEYKLKNKGQQPKAAYHFDAYRIREKDIIGLGWQEIAADRKNIIMIEWAERIRRIIPKSPAGRTVWIKFKWLDENRRKIKLGP